MSKHTYGLLNVVSLIISEHFAEDFSEDDVLVSPRPQSDVFPNFKHFLVGTTAVAPFFTG